MSRVIFAVIAAIVTLIQFATPTPTMAQAPSRPTGLTATAGDAQVSLAWTASSGATSYTIYRSTTSSSASLTLLVSGVTSANYVDTTVTNGVTYYYGVAAVNADGTSAKSTEANAEPMPPIPAAPTGLAATAGNAQVVLSWTASIEATSYNVYRGTPAGSEAGAALATGVTTTSYTDSTAVNGKTYYYVVEALNLSGKSGKSNEVSAEPMPPIPAAPGLTVTVDGNDIDLSWTASANATTYTVYDGTSSASPPGTTLAAGLTTTSYVFTGATLGKTYYFLVKAINIAGTSPASNTVSAIAPSIPSAPAGLTATAGNAQVALSWTASAGATSYNVYRGTTAGSEAGAPLATGVTTTTYTDSTAVNGKTYYYVVEALNISGKSGKSNEASAEPMPPLPSAPSLQELTGDGEVTLTWTASANATSYIVYNGTSSASPPGTTLVSGLTTTTYVDTSVVVGKTYYFLVKAVNLAGKSGASNIVSAKPIPLAPTTLTATAGDTQISLSWTASTGATSYAIYRGTTAGGESSTPIATVTGEAYTDTGLTDGTTYYYTVAAIDAGGTSSPSNEASATPLPPVAAAPSGLSATPGNAQVSLTWTASAGATSYDVYRGTSTGAESSTPIATVTGAAYVDTSVTNGTAYFYTVAAVNLAGMSGPSNEASATPLPPAPSAPTGLSATPGNAQVSLTWTASAGATSYDVYRGTSTGGESLTPIAVGVTGLAYTDTGVTNGTTYFYTVAAVNLGGTSGPSNEASAIPLSPIAAAPTGLSATGGAAQVSLTWTASTGATSYNVYRGTSTGGESSTPIATGVTGPSYTDSAVVNGVTYFYVVAAVNAGGVSGPSNEASASTTAFQLGIDSGGAAAGIFAADEDFSGGSTSQVSNTISTSLLSGAIPPQAVLQSNRWGTYTYTIPGMTPGGLYNVTLYFAEEFWTAAGKRVFDISINGTQVLTKFDIFATAGGEYIAIQRSFPATANSSGDIVITTKNVTDNAQINGILIGGGTGGLSPAAPANLGAVAADGGTQTLLSWSASGGATSYNVYRSTTSGGEGSTPIATGVTGTTYTDTAVTTGSTYYYTVSAVNPSGTSGMSNEASLTLVVERPFGGTAAQVPGTVQAENYDLGGQGVGYDVSSINGTANYYRPDGVDIEATFDNGNGYDVGWSSTGQWFNYTVNANTAGTYTVSFRLAAGGSGGSFHLQNSAGTNLTGSVSVGGTGDWQSWTTVNASVTLPAGVQTLTFYQDTGGYNINYMTFSYNGTAGPTGLAASGENQQVFLLWNAAGGATSYNLYRSTSPGAEGTTPYATGITSATYTDTNVANGVTYYYEIAAVNASGVSGNSNESSATPTTEGPFGGTPWPIPGTIQVENYDVGGQGVGYSDSDPTNNGGQYRTDGVDIENSTDLGGGYDVGWTNAGEWLNYTVNVTAAGSYVAQVRVASNGPGGTFHFNVDGASATSEITIPDTGGWQVWDTLTTPITLTAGKHVIQLAEDTTGSTGNVGNLNWFTIGPLPSPYFGSDVFTFSQSTPAASIQNQVNTIFEGQQFSQFGWNRCAFLFQPGTYNVDLPVGYYTQVLGLGALPDSTTINGYVQQSAALQDNNATCNFWSGVENVAINPSDSGGTDMWAVSQADPMRRVHIKGSLTLNQSGGYASGGFLADSLIDDNVSSGSQQQWMSRNDDWGSWSGSVWNMVFTGVTNAPSGTFPSPAYTVIANTPVVREKPFLTVDSNGNYSIFVPALRTASQGTTWQGGSPAGQSIPINQFYIAQPGVDNASSINAALSQGLNLILTPGMYILNGTIQVNNPGTVVLGIGLPTLVARNGITALSVADVDGVTVAGVVFDAASTSSPVLMQVGPSGSTATHSTNPTLLSDLFFRVGGDQLGQAAQSLVINSNNVIGDDFWVWRADHGTGVGWTSNTAANGLVVNGNNVTIYGLAVEHYQQYQTLWNGNGGQTYFYQSEAPYDVPNDASWMDGSVEGFASYKVANTVTSHQAYGLGVYCNFDVNSAVVLQNAIEAPQIAGVSFEDMVTISLGGEGTISSIIDGEGSPVSSSSGEATLVSGP